MRPENSFGAEWDPSVSGVVVRLSHHNHLLWPEEARMLIESLTKSLAGDEDPTPRLGTPKQRGRSAWRRFTGDMRHNTMCPGSQSEGTLEARIANRNCTCGLRDLVLALEDGA